MKKLLLFTFAFSVSLSLFSQRQNPVADNIASLCGPIPPVCFPGHLMGSGGGLGIGIHDVELNTINNPHNDTAGYQDYTCTDSTWLDPGVAYSFYVTTGQTYEESCTAWIDFSNDGSYDPSEIVFRDSAIVYNHVGFIIVPTNALHSFTPIRMRVGSEYSGNPPLNGCDSTITGRYEDYTIYYGTGTVVNEKEKNNSVIVTPNPFHENATLEIGKSKIESGKLKIYNALGAMVRKDEIVNIKSYLLHRGSLPDGLYYYELRTPHSELIGNGKFVIE